MAIKLRVISDQYRDLGDHRARVFGVNGGSIGRAPDNDWVLPDQKRLVSGHHCDIVYRTGHLELLSSPVVADQLKTWLTASADKA